MTRIAIDWGSTSFRAYRFDDNAGLQDTLALPVGIKAAQHLQPAERLAWFEQTLFDAVGNWLGEGDSILLSGMITSRNGWLETQYLDCPVSLSALLLTVAQIDCRGHLLKFLPGVALREQGADVMRGEELQLIGLTGAQPETYVMPGTHSKWVLASSETLFSFRTIPTGELYDVLLKHTLIGGLAADEPGEGDKSIFADAVQQGYKEDGFTAALFFARAGVLLDKLQARDVRPYLSGLLIGREIRDAMAVLTSQAQPTVVTQGSTGELKDKITLIGDSQLCSRYQHAFDILGLEACYEERDTTAMSFQTLLFAAD